MLAGACYLSGINSDARKTLNTIGTVFAVASVVSRIALIVVRSEAGRELQLSTTGITYKF